MRGLLRGADDTPAASPWISSNGHTRETNPPGGSGVNLSPADTEGATDLFLDGELDTAGDTLIDTFFFPGRAATDPTRRRRVPVAARRSRTRAMVKVVAAEVTRPQHDSVVA
jgi:hypothetical protein